MEITINLDKFEFIRYTFFKWRYETNLVYKVTLALSFACLIGLLSQFRFYLPNNPAIPITGQTFAVLLAGVVLGKWGIASIGMYIGIGAAGVPWFTPKVGMPIFSSGGLSVLTGATGGYLVGFMIAALFIGFFTDRYIRSRSFFSMLPIMFFANFVLIYIPGLTVFYLWWTSFIGPIGIVEVLTIGMVPFIAGDILKIVAASAVTKGITTKKSYGSEVDFAKAKN